jgi:FKBP-type peptidyl-prolyl cis-trans isomerase
MILFRFLFSFLFAFNDAKRKVNSFPLLTPKSRNKIEFVVNNHDLHSRYFISKTNKVGKYLNTLGETGNDSNHEDVVWSRRRSATGVLAAITATMLLESLHSSSPLAWALTSATNTKKCTDIESCREIGDEKLMEQLAANPITSLPSGVQYKVLQPPAVAESSSSSRGATVTDGSTVDLIYSVTGSGRYMFSQGFGYEDVYFDGKTQKDLGLDSLRIVVGKQQVPLGVEQALIGMKRGERRRVVVPPSVGFDTSRWKPEPTSRRGKAALAAYKQLVEGRGSTQPPFPAPTIWDVEVLSTRN